MAEPTLDPLRVALRSRADATARQLRADAERDAREMLASAGRQADELLARAREYGANDAAALITAERVRTQQTARAVVLSARRELYETYHLRSGDGVRRLLRDRDRRARLADTLHRLLGAAAVVTPTGDGGLAARTADGRSVDASVESLVASAIAAFDLEQLWA